MWLYIYENPTIFKTILVLLNMTSQNFGKLLPLETDKWKFICIYIDKSPKCYEWPFISQNLKNANVHIFTIISGKSNENNLNHFNRNFAKIKQMTIGGSTVAIYKPMHYDNRLQG